MICRWLLKVFVKINVFQKNVVPKAVLDGLGAILGRSWVALGPSWDRLGAVLGGLGDFLGGLGTP